MAPPVQHAGERLEQRRLGVGQCTGLGVQVGAHDRARQLDVLRVRAEDHRVHHLLAQVLLRAAAVITGPARGRRRRHHGVAGAQTAHLRADLGQFPGEFVSEQGRHGELRVAAQVGLQVGPTGQRSAHADDHAVRVRPRARHLAQLERAGTDEHVPAHHRQLGDVLFGERPRHRPSPLTAA